MKHKIQICESQARVRFAKQKIYFHIQVEEKFDFASDLWQWAMALPGSFFGEQIS